MKVSSGHDGSFAAALRAAIEKRNVTLTWLHRRLSDRGDPVSMATLSYWRSGARLPESTPSLSAVDEIEVLLCMDPGELSRLLTPPTRIGAMPPARIPNDDEITRAIEDTVATLGTVPPSGLRDLSTLVTAEVGPDGSLQTATFRALVQSTASVMTSIPVFDLIAAPGSEPKRLINPRGGHFEPTYHHPGGKIVCDLLVLDEPVPPGGTTMFEFTDVYPDNHSDARALSHDARALSHMVSRPAKQTVIWVRFDPAAIPDWCEEFVEDEDGATVKARDASSGNVHVHRFGFGPATLGVRWGFDDDAPYSPAIQPHAVA